MSTRVELDMGRTVLCDICNEDFTDSPIRGGMLFSTYAVGPCCTPRIYQSALDNGELQQVRARCPDGMTFGDWCRELRGGDNSIVIEVLDIER